MFGIIGAQIVLVCWIPVVLLLFMVLPSRLAMIAGSTAGMVILPNAGISLPGVPDYTKSSAIIFSLVLGTIIFNALAWSHFDRAGSISR